jgi:hypothetical protein
MRLCNFATFSFVLFFNGLTLFVLFVAYHAVTSQFYLMCVKYLPLLTESLSRNIVTVVFKSAQYWRPYASSAKKRVVIVPLRYDVTDYIQRSMPRINVCRTIFTVRLFVTDHGFSLLS